LRKSFSLDVFSCGDFDPENTLRLVREILNVADDRAHVINRTFPTEIRPSVYCITNNVNGKKYIGKSCDPSFRWGHHVWLASHPGHPQQRPIHAAMAKYGTQKFSFTLLEVCASEDLAYEREAHWIAALRTTDRDKGYNIHPGGRGGGSGEANGMFGRKHSEESKAKMSAALVGKNQGPKSDATKAAMSLAARRGSSSNLSVLTETDVVQIRKLADDGVQHAKIAKEVGVSAGTIGRIVRRKIWKHVD
jgi:group I intron endonuclease